MEIDEYALTKACKVYHDAKGQWADMTIRKCVEAYLEHSYKHTAEKLPTRDTDKLVGGDWNCEHGISHKQCGSCYDQTEPPYLDGLGAYVRSTDYEKLKLENAQLREILAECALDLKEEVAGRYTIEGRIHPAYQDRFDRDMQPVRKAESLLHPNKDSV